MKLGIAFLGILLLASCFSQAEEKPSHASFWKSRADDQLYKNPQFKKSIPEAVAFEMQALNDENPQEFYWLGLSAIASQEVAWTVQKVQFNRVVLKAWGPQHNWSQFLQNMLSTNHLIYQNFYWIFMAYQKKGIEEIRNFYSEQSIDARILDAFEQIHSGKVKEGNILILEIEQEFIDQTLDANTKKIFSWLTSEALKIPAFENIFFQPPLFGGEGFMAFSRRIGETRPDFGSYEQRFRFYSLSLMPLYMATREFDRTDSSSFE